MAELVPVGNQVVFTTKALLHNICNTIPNSRHDHCCVDRESSGIGTVVTIPEGSVVSLFISLFTHAELSVALSHSTDCCNILFCSLRTQDSKLTTSYLERFWCT